MADWWLPYDEWAQITYQDFAYRMDALKDCLREAIRRQADILQEIGVNQTRIEKSVTRLADQIRRGERVLPGDGRDWKTIAPRSRHNKRDLQKELEQWKRTEDQQHIEMTRWGLQFQVYLVRWEEERNPIRHHQD